MKAILMSVHPKWCEKIFNGEKTIEVRKSRPSIPTPFTVYVYQTKHKGGKAIVSEVLNSVYSGGKVIGSFVCDQIFEIPCETTQPHWLKESTRLTDEQYMEYLGNKNGYGWHITEPKLFDKPRELSEFYKPCPFNEDCDILCPYAEGEYHGDGINGDVEFIGCLNRITRPPQSWCYVEEEK